MPTKIRLRSVRVALFLLIILSAPGAHAEWLEASSDHFLIYANAKEEWMRDYATTLERFDRGVRRIYRLTGEEDPGARSNRVIVFVLDSVSQLQSIYNQNGQESKGVAGFYLPRAGGSLMFTPRSARNDGVSNSVRIIQFHEYAHHVSYHLGNDAMPQWLSEGFAEFASTARVYEDGGFGFGIPPYHRAYGLFGIRGISIEELFTSAEGKLSDRDMNEFYGRGWLLTHYLYFNVERRGQLGAYLKIFNEGVPSLEAAHSAFGDLQELDRELTRYLKRRNIPYIKLPAADLPVGKMDVRAMGEGPSEMMMVHIRSTAGVTRETALKIVVDARRVGGKYPNDPVVQSWLAEAEFDAGDYAAADAAVQRALAADPKNVPALLYRGQLLQQQAQKEQDKALWAKARTSFARANQVDPDAARPLEFFYGSFRRQGIEPTSNAVDALKRAYMLSPEDYGLRLNVAGQYLTEKNFAAARVALKPIAYSPHESGARKTARQMIKAIDEGEADQALALVNEKPLGAKDDSSGSVAPPPTPQDEGPESAKAPEDAQDP